MEVFPELYELLGFFESEPELTDRDVPVFYNRLTYRTFRGENEIYCEIEPGYGQIVLVWKAAGKLVLSLNLENVSSLRVVSEKGVEKIVAEFPPTAKLLNLEFQLKPNIQANWGNLPNV